MTAIARVDELACGKVLTRTARRPTGEEVGILLLQAGEGIFAYENLCPHMGVPLDGGTGRVPRKRDHVFCAAHFATFDAATGVCIWGPCQGRALEPVPIAVVDGEVRLHWAAS
ncbi:Rieske (2Fe-2S) protein [Arenibaculum pallidiluteum]|uniref:Rieske (2Fe-2S) protein n=1 Tax=Arenibaculum pallidiluteum TaxID=2812559 RepID=UPI001A97B972|nr:Rieske 2Fe-2S domain-containing protein [Arenibaculum pallidiluteum]